MNRLKFEMAYAIALASLYANENTVFDIPSKEVSPNYNPNPPKRQHRQLRIFVIKGVEIEAHSKNDTIKRYNHRYNKK